MKIEYVHNMGNSNKPYTLYDENEIPKDILEIISNNKEFSVSKSFGQKGLGSPDEIEVLHIILDNGEQRKFQYYNKGIYYMLNGGEHDRPVFQVFAHFMIKERS
jgi:hypothetical protein